MQCYIPKLIETQDILHIRSKNETLALNLVRSIRWGISGDKQIVIGVIVEQRCNLTAIAVAG